MVSRGIQGDHGGVEATGVREAVGGVALDVLGEGLPKAFGRGLALVQGSLAGAVLGGGEREECLLEHRAGEAVEGEPAVELAVAVLPHRQASGCGGVALLLLQELRLVLVGLVGGDDLEKAAREVLQRFGVEVLRQPKQVLLSLPLQLWLEVLRKGVEAAQDGVDLLDAHPTLGECRPDRLMVLQSLGQTHLAVGVTAGDLVPVGEPVRQRRRTGLGRQVDRLGMDQHPRLELDERGLGRLNLCECLRRLRGGHRPGSLIRHGGEVTPGVHDRGMHPVHRWRRDRCHASTTPMPTDTPDQVLRSVWRTAGKGQLCTVRGQSRGRAALSAGTSRG